MPVLVNEFDDLPQELRKDVAGTIHLWPKLDGANIQPSSATFVVKGPGGESVQGTTSATLTTISSVSRINCAVSAISVLDEDYRVEITWVLSGTSYFDVVLFDVVLYPFGQALVSYSDMVTERPEADHVLTRLDQLLGTASNEECASIYCRKGHVALDGMIRASVSDHNTGVGLGNHTRPYLILNREKLKPTALFLAMRELYKADARDLGEDSEEGSALLYREYKKLAEDAWRSVGPLKFNTDDDLEPEAVEQRVGGIVQQARGW